MLDRINKAGELYMNSSPELEKIILKIETGIAMHDHPRFYALYFSSI